MTIRNAGNRADLPARRPMREPLIQVLTSGCAFLTRFRRDQSGSYLVMSALMMPALIGAVGLGTDYGLWTYAHQTIQSAADSGAISAATAYSNGILNVTTQANGVVGSYKLFNGDTLVNGVSGVTVTVNRPPQSGNYTT